MTLFKREELGQHARWLPYVSFALAAFALLLFRMPERLLQGYLWAEDSRVFVHDACVDGWRDVFVTYAGYLHAVPRIVTSLVANMAHLQTMPMALVWICAVLTVASSTYLFHVAMEEPIFQRRLPLIAAAALAPLWVPHSGEVYLTVTNLQWVLCPALLGLVWELFLRGEPRWKAPGIAFALRCVAIVLLAGTGPFAAFLLPVVLCAFVWRKYYLGGPRAWIALTCLVVPALVQAWLAHQAGSAEARQELPWLIDGAHYLVAMLFIPPPVLPWLDHPVRVGLLLCAAIVVVAASGWGRWVCLGLLAFGALLWWAAIFRLNLPNAQVSWSGDGTRYTFVPAVALAWLLLVGFAGARTPSVRMLAGGLLLMMLMTSLTRFSLPQNGPWTMQAGADGERTLISPPGPDWFARVPAGKCQ